MEIASGVASASPRNDIPRNMRRCIQTAAGGQTHDSTFEATDTTDLVQIDR